MTLGVLLRILLKTQIPMKITTQEKKNREKSAVVFIKPTAGFTSSAPTNVNSQEV